MLDRYAAADFLRPILAEFGLRGCAELTAQLRLAEASAREAVGSRAFQRAVGTHVLLEYSLHQLGHRRDFRSVAGADNTTSNNSIAGCYFF